ncbi:hypothetical protein [Bacillus sp. SM2101]|uniref:hypothetical protein n=1 Tax=Bacillus sp. SM2101 TaxID=2805366 RepID=UPI001BDE5AEF|nr:hypothetical protein [Bacillus sp. SM2101]
MGMPVAPELPDYSEENVLLFLLATVGFEELALAHIMNAEGEKIQAAVSAFESDRLVTLRDLMDINNNVAETLKRVIQKEILLDFKVDDIKELLERR